MTYIGRDSVYGLFEKQVIIPVPGRHEYPLTWQVGSSTSLLVVSGGQVLEPITNGYTISLAGNTIIFNDVPAAGTYLIYLGRELEVAHRVGINPVLNQFVASAGQTDFIVTIGTETIAVYPASIIVFVDGVQQTPDHDSVAYDFSVAGNVVTFHTAPGAGKQVDIYVHGVERFDQYGDLEWKQYTPQFSSFGGMTVTSPQIHTAQYLVTGIKVPSALPHRIYQNVKVKLDFAVALGGTASDVVRYTLPDIGDLIDECVPANVNINYYNLNIRESGIQTWAGVNSCDIRRQHGINYIISNYVRFKVRAEYDILAL